ncbi:IS110 family transposase [Methylovirgula sp. 4M-Z18]|uniref:IS110 family transposase n=1 Tax=Methylovirgula sp. 4M-Z18 TaxID=2293567 RepID=UPI000E2E48FF|nr:transposase [Methylovirgula sp. 4M-Z18]RFB78093.1 IS110 family transposase [Methylovirgula sp. 4M-Z18]
MIVLSNAAGIDAGRDFLDVAVEPCGHVRRVANAPAGIKALLAWLTRRQVRRVVLEAIGPYAARLVRALADTGFEVGLVDPRRIRAWRTAEGRRAKTDRLDAKLIARFALRMENIIRPVPTPQAQRIKALSTRRRQIVEMIAMEKTRLKQAFDADIAQNHRETIAFLTSQRAALEAELTACLTADDGGARLALLQTAPGVGPAVAITLLADLPELGTLDRRAVASLAGLAPQITQSGLDKGQAHIAGGRPCLRNALYMAALAATRSKSGMRSEYEAMRNAGKPPKVALIAIARKLLVILNHMMRERRPWTPNPSQKT